MIFSALFCLLLFRTETLLQEGGQVVGFDVFGANAAVLFHHDGAAFGRLFRKAAHHGGRGAERGGPFLPSRGGRGKTGRALLRRAGGADRRFLRRLFRAHGGGHIQVWQGEGGYPHWVPEGYWQKRAHRESYLAQANWLMRRFLIDHALEIELSSFYMTVDFMEKSYQTGRSTHDPFQVQRQGVLNGICYTPNPSYLALAHVAALFQHHPRPHDAMITCSMGRTRPPTVELPHLEEVALWRKLFVRDDGVQLFTYYMPVSIEYPFQEISDFTLFLHDEPGLPPMENPVLVDLLTGDVWKLSYRRDKYSLVFEGLPLSSTPRVIMDGGKLPPVLPGGFLSR